MSAYDRHTFFCELCDAMYVIDPAEDKSRLCDRCYLACNPHPPIGSLVRYADCRGRIVIGAVIDYRGRGLMVQQKGRIGHSIITRWERVTP